MAQRHGDAGLRPMRADARSAKPPEEMVLMRTLSKSDFKVARTCPAKLYYRELGYTSLKDDDPFLELLAEDGYVVEALAKLQFPDGIALEYGADPVADAARTMEYLKRPDVVLFEGTLLSGRRLARADIIVKRGGEINLIEVKATSFDSSKNAGLLAAGKPGLLRAQTGTKGVRAEWREYVEDVAYQYLLLERLVPGARITPFLYLVDMAATTLADGLSNAFRIVRRPSVGGGTDVLRVETVGDVARLRAERLLTLVDVTDEVRLVRDDVEAAAALFESSYVPEIHRLPAPIGTHCGKCEFRMPDSTAPNGFRECWGQLADARPSVLDLYRVTQASGPEDLIRNGAAGLLDLPVELVASWNVPVTRDKSGKVKGAWERRRFVQVEHTRRNSEWLDPALAAGMASVTYPLHFLDFETTTPAIPAHRGMHPYAQVPFQWSCHTVPAPGVAPVHAEWLNGDRAVPTGAFLRTLREQISEIGTVLTWSSHERSALRKAATNLSATGEVDAELEAWVGSVTESERIVDQHALAFAHFFHPGMGGSTSIKVVLDALWRSDPQLRSRHFELTGRDVPAEGGPYRALPPLVIDGVNCDVADGTGAIRAYQAMMHGSASADPEAKAQWRKLLLTYCHLDTVAMVLIWEHWERALKLL